MTPPSLRSLLAKATPGPWTTYDGTTIRHGDGIGRLIACLDPERVDLPYWYNAQIIARCNPSVMAQVFEALEKSRQVIQQAKLSEAYRHTDNHEAAGRFANRHRDVKRIEHVLSLLNGTTQP